MFICNENVVGGGGEGKLSLVGYCFDDVVGVEVVENKCRDFFIEECFCMYKMIV